MHYTTTATRSTTAKRVTRELFAFLPQKKGQRVIATG